MSKLEGSFYGFYPSLGDAQAFNSFNTSNFITFIPNTNGTLNGNGLSSTSFFGSFNQNSIDSDADSFLRTAGLLGSANSTIQNAIHYLVFSLKQYGLWNKMVLIYPFVGGTSTTHQYNLKNTSTFAASFVNSPTHGPRGVTCNGTNQYINSTLIASQSLSSPDVHFSIYLNDLTKSGSIGSGLCGNDSSNGAYLLINPCQNTTLGYFYGGGPIYNSSANITNAHVPTSGPNGFTCGNRIDTMNTYAQRDNKINSRANVLGPSTAAASRFRTTDTMFLMARKSGINTANYIANTIAWASLGYGLQPQEMTTLYNIVHKYQSLLNRAAFDSP